MGPIMPQLLVMRCVARGRPHPEWKNLRQRRIILRCGEERARKSAAERSGQQLLKINDREFP